MAAISSPPQQAARAETAENALAQAEKASGESAARKAELEQQLAQVIEQLEAAKKAAEDADTLRVQCSQLESENAALKKCSESADDISDRLSEAEKVLRI